MSAERSPLPPAFAGRHAPKPLTFDPAKLPGLSERLVRSHWENNYVGSVKALNMIEGRLAAAMLAVLDMYEHAYHMDYGTAAAKYIDAWFANLDWEIVNQRYLEIRSVAG